VTPAQDEALKRISSLVSEHFDSGVVVVTVEHDGTDACDRTEVWWRGGLMAAIGMSEYASYVLKRRKEGQVEPS